MSDYPGVEYENERDVMAEREDRYTNPQGEEPAVDLKQIRAIALNTAASTLEFNNPEDLINAAKAFEDFIVNGAVPGPPDDADRP